MEKLEIRDVFKKELQATSWIDDEIKFTIFDGNYYLYKQDWPINGIRVATFRYKVDPKTLQVCTWSTFSGDWVYSHTLFEC